MSTARRYDHDAPFDTGFLSAGSIHKVHYEQYGKKDGKPILFVHGGPGGGTSKASTVFFDPRIYRVILFDQRGCAQSLPLGEIRENTTQHLISDIEALRAHLGVSRWHVFGGSWGSTLSLLYAQAHPEPVVSLTLRGIFLESKEELDFNTVPSGTWRMHPELYEEFIGFLPEEDRGDVMKGYARKLTCGDRATELAAAKAYEKWGTVMGRLLPSAGAERYVADSEWSKEADEHEIAKARIECYYHDQKGMIRDKQILEAGEIERIKEIPTQIVNGRYDLLCPPIMAWRLHKALPGSKLHIIPDAGHVAGEIGTQNKLVEICDEIAQMDF